MSKDSNNEYDISSLDFKFNKKSKYLFIDKKGKSSNLNRIKKIKIGKQAKLEKGSIIDIILSTFDNSYGGIILRRYNERSDLYNNYISFLMDSRVKEAFSFNTGDKLSINKIFSVKNINPRGNQTLFMITLLLDTKSNNFYNSDVLNDKINDFIKTIKKDENIQKQTISEIRKKAEKEFVSFCNISEVFFYK